MRFLEQRRRRRLVIAHDRTRSDSFRSNNEFSYDLGVPSIADPAGWLLLVGGLIRMLFPVSLSGMAASVGEYVHTHGRKVEEVMTRDPYTVSEGTPLEKVVRIMERKNVKRVPVLREAKLVGIITRANLLHAIACLAENGQPVAGGDAAILDGILSELAKLPWRATVSVNVRDGVVDLCGTILSEGEREALIVAVENMPGVKAVHDHVMWVEPNSGMVFASPEDERAEVDHAIQPLLLEADARDLPMAAVVRSRLYA